MFAHNQSRGTTPVSRESWNIVVKAGAISSAVVLKTHGDISSGPAALCEFRFFSNLTTPSSLTTLLGIDGKLLSFSIGKSSRRSWVNWLWYCRFNKFAFSLLSVTSSPVCVFLSAGIPVESFLSVFTKLQNCLTDSRHFSLTYFLYAFLDSFLTSFRRSRYLSQSSCVPLFLALL